MKKGLIIVLGLLLVGIMCYTVMAEEVHLVMSDDMDDCEFFNSGQCREPFGCRYSKFIEGEGLFLSQPNALYFWDGVYKDCAMTFIDGKSISGTSFAPFNLTYKNITYQGYFSGHTTFYNSGCSWKCGTLDFQNSSTIGSFTATSKVGNLFFGIIQIEGDASGLDHIIIDGHIEYSEAIHEQRILALEQLVNAIETQLESVKQWLFFWNWQGAEENVCDAIENECGDTTTCTNECSQGSNGCIDDNTRWTCQLQNDGCYDKTPTECNQGEACDGGVCAPASSGEVIFRTDVMNGNYYGCTLSTNCWIAVDYDGDGDLDAMGFDGKSTSCHTGTNVVNTPEGYPVVNYGVANKLAICDSNKKESRFSIARIPQSPELSDQPTEPYTSNNQEVYGGSGSSGNSSGNGGGGSLVNISINT